MHAHTIDYAAPNECQADASTQLVNSCGGELSLCTCKVPDPRRRHHHADLEIKDTALTWGGGR